MSVRKLLAVGAALACAAACRQREATPDECRALVTGEDLARACGAPLTLTRSKREGGPQNVCDREVGEPERKLRLVVMEGKSLEAARSMGRNAEEGEVVTSSVHPTEGYRVEDATVRIGRLVLSMRNQVRGGGPGLCPPSALEELARTAARRAGGPVRATPAEPGVRLAFRIDRSALPAGLEATVAAAEATKTIERRLAALETRATVTRAGEVITVELLDPAVAIAEVRDLVARPGTLAISRVTHDSPAMAHFHRRVGADARMAAAGIEAVSEPWSHQDVQLEDSFLRAGSREVLAAHVSALELEGGLAIAYERDARGWRTHVVRSQAEIDGASIASATASRNVGAGAPSVLIQLDATGTRRLAAMTREHKGHRLAFIVDGEVVMAPVVFAAITDGGAAITLGTDSTERDARQLAAVLRAGALPAPLMLVQ